MWGGGRIGLGEGHLPATLGHSGRGAAPSLTQAAGVGAWPDGSRDLGVVSHTHRAQHEPKPNWSGETNRSIQQSMLRGVNEGWALTKVNMPGCHAYAMYACVSAEHMCD